MAASTTTIRQGLSALCQPVCQHFSSPHVSSETLNHAPRPSSPKPKPVCAQKSAFIGSLPLPGSRGPSFHPSHRLRLPKVPILAAAADGSSTGTGPSSKPAALRRKKSTATATSGAASPELTASSTGASIPGAPARRGRKKKVVEGAGEEGGDASEGMMDGSGETKVEPRKAVAKKGGKARKDEADRGMMERPSWIDDDDAEPRWYVAAVFAGWEQKLANTFNTMLSDDARMSRLIREVLVPTVPTGRMCKDGRPSKAVRKLMPGYVLFRCALTRESRKYITDVDGVMDFVGARKSTGYISYETLPRPLSDAEVAHLFQLMEEGKRVSEAPRFPLAVNDVIEVTDGPFKEFAGEIVEVYPKENKVKAILSIFGRDTPVELAVDACRKRSAVV
eukprot:jgi/Mesvir1/22921/Mv19438-RA.1